MSLKSMNESNEENIRYENEIFFDIIRSIFLLKNLTIVRSKN